MKALDYATPEQRQDDGYEWFTVDPDEMYPAALEYAAQLLQDGSDIPMYLRQHVEKLRAAELPPAAWKEALEPFGDLGPKRRADREVVLEGARLIFTARLREQVGGPIGMHITKSERWRL